jgi:hypothetical protein
VKSNEDIILLGPLPTTATFQRLSSSGTFPAIRNVQGNIDLRYILLRHSQIRPHRFASYRAL